MADARLANGGRPVLWQSRSNRQLFLCSLITGVIGDGPAVTCSAHVPDLHFFRGSFGGKDIIPLYRDAAATAPNFTAGLAAMLGKRLGIAPPSVEDFAAYVYALLGASSYQERFAARLERPGLRVPLTADAELWSEAVGQGRALLWLHTYTERFVDPKAERPAQLPLAEGIGWDREVTRIPEDMRQVAYDAKTGTLTIGDGQVGGIRPDVWTYAVSGMQVLPKWLGYRTRKGAGRAVSSKSALDHIRPEVWADEWNDELLELVTVLTRTLDRQPALADLLDRVCDGPLISAALLPRPSQAERDPPPTAR